MSQLEIFLRLNLTQAPNTSMQISRNIGATMTACLTSNVIKNRADFYVLCCSRPTKFKLIIFGINFDI